MSTFFLVGTQLGTISNVTPTITLLCVYRVLTWWMRGSTTFTSSSTRSRQSGKTPNRVHFFGRNDFQYRGPPSGVVPWLVTSPHFRRYEGHWTLFRVPDNVKVSRGTPTISETTLTRSRQRGRRMKTRKRRCTQLFVRGYLVDFRGRVSDEGSLVFNVSVKP